MNEQMNEQMMGVAETNCHPECPPSATLSSFSVLFHCSAPFAVSEGGVRVGKAAGGCWLVQAYHSGPAAPALVLTWAIAVSKSLLRSPEEGPPHGSEGDTWRDCPSSFLGHCHVCR